MDYMHPKAEALNPEPPAAKDVGLVGYSAATWQDVQPENSGLGI